MKHELHAQYDTEKTEDHQSKSRLETEIGMHAIKDFGTEQHVSAWSSDLPTVSASPYTEVNGQRFYTISAEVHTIPGPGFKKRKKGKS